MVGREEAVFDGCRAARLAVAHEAGVVAAFRPLKAANEGTAAYRELGIVAQTGHEAAVGIARAADGHRRDAALDAHRTAIDYLGNQSTRILAAGAPGASRLEVLDGGVAHVAEGGKVLLREVGHVEGQRVAVAVEGALERVGIAGTRHRRDADVGGQFHELADVGSAMADAVGELIPVGGGTDEVGVGLRAGMILPGRLWKDRRDGDVFVLRVECVSVGRIARDGLIAATHALAGNAGWRAAVGHIQRDCLAVAEARRIGFDSAVAYVDNGDSVGILYGMAIEE